MIRRTPQEIADFFGIYLAQNISGDWHGYEEKPIKQKSGNWGIRDFSAAEIGMDEYIIDLPDYNEYGKLYIPNVSENPTSSTVSEMENVVAVSKNEITREDSAEIEQAKDHYVIAYGDCIAGLTGSVNAYLSEGYKLAGNLVIDKGEFYQPMIKDN